MWCRTRRRRRLQDIDAVGSSASISYVWLIGYVPPPGPYGISCRCCCEKLRCRDDPLRSDFPEYCHGRIACDQ